MELNNLKPAVGATKSKKRIGRGTGSGHGKTATKGHKGQKARSGGSVKPGFEGGQMPMYRRLPKRGFTPLVRIEYSLINLCQLNELESGSTVDPEFLLQKGYLSKIKDGIKILAKGEITKPITVRAHRFSATAREKILSAGGTVEEIQH